MIKFRFPQNMDMITRVSRKRPSQCQRKMVTKISTTKYKTPCPIVRTQDIYGCLTM
jgi:hypothetical protein